MTDAALLTRAASCYLRGGAPDEAALCYREARAYRRAAETWESIGALAEAAADYAAADMHERAAWILVHDLGDPAAARAEFASAEAQAATQGHPLSEILRHIVRARCNVAEQTANADTLAVLQEVMDYLEQNEGQWNGTQVESWATAVAEAMVRPDLVALLFAASVRGGRYQAAQRWNEWSIRTLDVPLVLPEPGSDPAMPNPGRGHDGFLAGSTDDRARPFEDR
jgi:hypothetical protein